jgi:light-regulated signal transduction histidine kinase (bacteriophytochrome)
MGESNGLEFELSENEGTADHLLAAANDSFHRFEQLDSPERLYEEAVSAIRHVTGYDRVMLYRFDRDGHGSVEAEDKRSELHSYLGQQFPASDIPVPARRLYKKNRLRYIPRVNYDPVPLIGPEGERQSDDVDLTYSSLRNVPLVHRKYLQNMKVGASVSVSLIVDGELWGLLACHALEPRALSGPKRNACKLIGQSVSQHIHRFETEKRNHGLRETKEFREKFKQTSTSFSELFDQLKRKKLDILSLLESDAFIIRVNDQSLWMTGESTSIPEEPVENLIQDQLQDQHLVQVESIIDELDSDWTHSPDVSGFLAYRIGQSPDSFCAWVRPEYQHTIQWGGDPRNPVEVDEEGQLSPRSSFEEWTQVVEEQCRRWTETDIMMAEELIHTFEGGLLGVQSHELREANQAKETLMQEIHHRVENNFSLAASLVGLQKRQIDDRQVTQQLNEVYNRLHSMAELHKVLYTGDDVQEVDMKVYATKILKNVRDNFQSDDHQFSYETSLETFNLPTSQAMYCGLILSELVSDSIEHGIQDTSDGVVTVKMSRTDEDIRLLVEDNGPGWKEDFDPFASDSLGLKIVRELVQDQLNGSLEASGSDGATFEIHFPVDQNYSQKI